MKKFYIAFIAILIAGIAAGIFFLEVIRPGAAELPNNVVMKTAFDNDYDFAERPKRARLIEFMYTSCPDICPVTTLEMAKLKNRLETEGIMLGDKVEFMTITIDPKVDSTGVMHEYANKFEVQSDEQGWYFLTGTEEATRNIADSLGFLYRDPGSGEIIHSTYMYFMDENDHLLEKFTMGKDFDRDRAFKRIMRTIN